MMIYLLRRQGLYVKNKFLLWFINCLTGTFFSFGLVSTIYLFMNMGDNSVYDRKMVLFILITLFVGWVCSFIYHFNTNLAITALLHSTVWFMLAAICYMSLFDTSIEIEALMKTMILYGATYCLGLVIFRSVSKKLNTPFRHFNEFISKLTQFITK